MSDGVDVPVADAAAEDLSVVDAERLREGLAWVREQPVGERQAAARRLGSALRTVIDQVAATMAETAVLERAASQVESLVALLAAQPAGRAFEGFAEAANAGRSLSFFDWSPLAGVANPLAPPIELDVVGEIVVGTVRFGHAYEGPPGCVHGGYIAAGFDDVLGMTQSLSGQVGMTGTITVRYRHPTPLNVPLRFEGRLDELRGRKVLTSATLAAGDLITAEATAVFISVGAERFVGGHLGGQRDERS